MKKALWVGLGLIFVGLAYIGTILPGVPTTFFVICAAWAFSKSSQRMHEWLYNHPWFGKFLTEWTYHKVFPFRAKIAMIIVMASTLAFTYFMTQNIKAVLYSGICMALVAIWAWRFPSSIEEWEARKKSGKKIGWIK